MGASLSLPPNEGGTKNAKMHGTIAIVVKHRAVWLCEEFLNDHDLNGAMNSILRVSFFYGGYYKGL